MVETLTATVEPAPYPIRGLLPSRLSVLGQPVGPATRTLLVFPVYPRSRHHLTSLFWPNPILNHYQHMLGIPNQPIAGQDPGLSLRVQGNRDTACGSSTSRRSIPACAGEPSKCSAQACASWVYPRVCGGTALSMNGKPAHGGLSPRVRGNQYAGLLAGVSVGSIPACAGEPANALGWMVYHTVYPRVCGGTPTRPAAPPVRRGLSPRVRGNPPHRQ